MGQLISLHYPEFIDDDHARYIGLKKDKNGNWYLPEFTDSGSDFNRKYTQIIRLGHVRKVIPTKFKESSIRELLDKLTLLEQPLDEGTSLKTTINAIVADIGDPVIQVYDRLKIAATQYHDSHGNLDSFNLLKGSIGSRWYNEFYFNRLQKELHHLTRYAPNDTRELRNFLDLNIKSFSAIAEKLPYILAECGKRLNAPQLTNAAKRWISEIQKFNNHLSAFETSDSEEDDTPEIPQPRDNLSAQQRTQAEEQVEFILSRLPKAIRGDIRQIINRKDNKLQALMQELRRRGIQI